MAISERDIKLLWGAAAGICSNPECKARLIEINERGESYLTGEMAHVIAKRIGGPRANDEAGPDSYDNLILLCPSCHTKIDKAPEGTFPASLLYEWKALHEQSVANFMKPQKIHSQRELVKFIATKLHENEQLFVQYGPQSATALENPMSNSHSIWVARKIDRILPNNRSIVRAFDEYPEFVPEPLLRYVSVFTDHALSFEQSQYDRKESYTLFPVEFQKIVYDLEAE